MTFHVDNFSNFSLWSHLWIFFSSFGTSKEARKTGQSVTLAKVSLAKMSPSKVTLAKLSLAKVSLAKRSLCPKFHSGQSVPTKVSLANYDSAEKWGKQYASRSL